MCLNIDKHKKRVYLLIHSYILFINLGFIKTDYFEAKYIDSSND